MSYCPHCRHCHPRDTPAAQVVSGRSGPDVAPLLSAIWAEAVARLDDREWRRRYPIAVDVAASTGGAASTVANLFRAAIAEGVCEQVLRRDDDGHTRAWVRIATQPTTATRGDVTP